MIVLLLLNQVATPVSANSDIYIWTQAAILIESETGKVMYEQDADKEVSPASLTKMMTFLLALEAVESGAVEMNDEITISSEASKVGGSSYKLLKGEILDLEELVNALMIVSCNGAAVAIAEHIAKSEEKFIGLMNTRAKEIGMKSTNFINPHGLPVYGSDGVLADKNVSTARELAILAQYLLENYKDETLDVTGKKVFQSKYKNYMRLNTNQLLHEVEGIDGLKTGFTGSAGYCLAFTQGVKAKDKNYEDMRLIGITLGAGNNRDRTKESKKLFKYGATEYIKKNIIDAGQYISDVDLYKDERFKVRVITGNKLTVVAKQDDVIKDEVYNIYNLEYPVVKGQKVGEIIYTLYDNTKAKVDLISGNEITTLPFLFKIKVWLQNLFSKI